MRGLAGRIARCWVVTLIVSACSPPSPATHPSDSPADAGTSTSLQSAQLQLSCLLAEKALQQIEACSTAINSGSLSPKELSNSLAVRGSVYLRLLRLTDARIDLEEAKRVDPGNPLIDRGLELLEIAEKRTSAAQASQVYTLADCAESQDSLQRLAACDQLVAAAAGNPAEMAKAYELRAFVRLQERNPSGALDDLDKAMALLPDSAELKDHRSRALFMAEKYNEALPGLEDALAREPFNDSLKSMVATIYYVEGDPRRAFSEFYEMRYWKRQEDLPAARAAAIQSELRTDEDLFERLAASLSAPRWLGIIGNYRMSLIPEPEFRSGMEAFVPAAPEFTNCLIEFHVGHKAAIDGEPIAARAAFSKAITSCSLGDFEYHAAKKWLLKLGAGRSQN